MTQTSVVPRPALRRIVEGATRAPSVHNTQPWRWRATSHTLELFADRDRQLRATDPDGRNMIISCGAALHHAQVVAAALGWSALVTRHPDPAEADLLARLDFSPAPPPADSAETLDAVEHRYTDRRRFTSWPVPDERLARLAAIASEWGTRAAPLTDVTERTRAERLVMRAADLQAGHRASARERDQWLTRGTLDGIPPAALEGSGTRAGAHRHRFETGLDTLLDGQDVQLADGLVLLFDSHDDATSWLRAGEGLSAMWLAAVVGGLSMVPLSQVIEMHQTREAFRAEVLGGLGHPLLLARVGWQEISRGELARVPRRPLEEVLDEV